MTETSSRGNRRSRLLTLGPAWATALVAGLAVLGGGDVAAARAVGCWEEAYNDFNGGGPDVVLGLPNYDWPGHPDAGAIVVFSNVGAAGASDPSAPTKSEIFAAADFGLTVQTNAHFGAAVNVWNDEFADPDHCSDLLVGAPGQTVNGKAGAGELYLIRGGDSGLGDVDQTYNEDDLNVGGVTGGAQAGAAFGSEVASSTLGFLAIGAPGRDIGSATDAGRIVGLNYLVSDEPPEVQVYQQGGTNADSPESGDRFGEVLDLQPSGDGYGIVVGIPHEDVGRLVDAGAVALIPPGGQPMMMVDQDSPGAAGAAEAGDRYGASVDVYTAVLDEDEVLFAGLVATGVPGEDIGGKSNAGSVAYSAFAINLPEEGWGPLRGRDYTVTQSSPGVPGSVESGDGFGSSVLSGEFGFDDGRQRLIVGAPGENLGSVVDGGMLSSTRTDEAGRPNGGPQPGPWSQDSAGVSGVVEKGDRFGSRLSALEISHIEEGDDDLTWPIYLVTVPSEDRGSAADAGMAHLGVAPGTKRSVALLPPNPQTGGGLGMVPMRADADLAA